MARANNACVQYRIIHYLRSGNINCETCYFPDIAYADTFTFKDKPSYSDEYTFKLISIVMQLFVSLVIRLSQSIQMKFSSFSAN